MKNILKTTLALLFAGVINLQAQNTTPTVAEEQWSALLAAQASAGVPPGSYQRAAAVSPEGTAIKNSIMASQGELTGAEFYIVLLVTRELPNQTERQADIRALAASNRTGEGMNKALATVKNWDGSIEEWTEEMLNAAPHLAGPLAMRINAAPAFRDRVWEVTNDRSSYNNAAFFKSYRSALPKAKQIEVTQRQKDFTLALPNRSARANAWLADVSADLIALQLDQ